MHLSLPIEESRFRRQIERFIRTIVPPQSRPFNTRLYRDHTDTGKIRPIDRFQRDAASDARICSSASGFPTCSLPTIWLW
jgi:hypothetical protein